MHITHTDHRSTPLRTLCTISTNAIDELFEFSKSGLFDESTAMEYIYYLHGAVLVACQAYAVGTVSDINKIRKHKNLEKLNKHILYKSVESNIIKYTDVQLINALANYFKHNEEWSIWPNNGITKTLKHFDINESTTFPLHSGIIQIIGDSSDLRGICISLELWRSHIFDNFTK